VEPARDTLPGVDHRDELIRSGLTLAAELGLEGVLQRIIELAVELTDATYGALGVLGSDGTIKEFVTTGISHEERSAIGHEPTGRGVLGLLIREPRPLRIARISEHPASFGFPPNHPSMTTFLGAPVTARGQVFGNIYLTDKRGGGDFDDEDEQALVVLAAQAGIAVENARLYEAARTRQRWLEAVREIGEAILSRSHPDEALQLIAQRAVELVSADLAIVSVPDGPSHLRVAYAEGMNAPRLLGMSFPMEGSIAGEVVRTGTPAVVSNAATDERAYGPLVAAGGFGPVLIVPLSAQGRAFGTLSAANRLGAHAFGEQQVKLLETFADQAAVALEYARAQQEIERLAVLEDRERIAKELHDGVIQALFAVGMGLEGTAMVAEDDELSARIEGAVNELDRVIRDLRNYIFGLRPGILADRELDKALRALVEEFQARSGVLTIVDVDEEVAAELASVATDVIQLTREALSNVGRHAEAATCRVSLRHRDHVAVLEIDDDGRGFAAQTTKRGDGLTNLEDRAAALGGKTSIESVPTQGTTVRIELPL
jgi:signal transduction histidine kinase